MKECVCQSSSFKGRAVLDFSWNFFPNVYATSVYLIHHHHHFCVQNPFRYHCFTQIFFNAGACLYVLVFEKKLMKKAEFNQNIFNCAINHIRRKLQSKKREKKRRALESTKKKWRTSHQSKWNYVLMRKGFFKVKNEVKRKSIIISDAKFMILEKELTMLAEKKSKHLPVFNAA